MLLTPAQIKPKSFESSPPFFSFFLPGVDASHVYVRATALGWFHSLISTETFRMALTASVHGQLRGDKECPFSGVTMKFWQSLEEGVGKQGFECGMDSVFMAGSVTRSLLDTRTFWYRRPWLRHGGHVRVALVTVCSWLAASLSTGPPTLWYRRPWLGHGGDVSVALVTVCSWLAASFDLFWTRAHSGTGARGCVTEDMWVCVGDRGTAGRGQSSSRRR